jgi:DNA-nicking Smr family endonuclease
LKLDRPEPARPISPPPPDRESPDEPDEASLFATAMQGIRPLESGAGASPEPIRPARPRPRLPAAEREAAEVLQALQDLVDGEAPLSIHETDEAVEGLADGVDPRLLRRLKRGEFSTQDHLDLHGLTREEARPEVVRFLEQAMALGKRCVLIVHGRGHGSKDHVPVLKLALQVWLIKSGMRKHILAFCTARPCDGGAGALYVLLRKARALR